MMKVDRFTFMTTRRLWDVAFSRPQFADLLDDMSPDVRARMHRRKTLLSMCRSPKILSEAQRELEAAILTFARDLVKRDAAEKVAAGAPCVRCKVCGVPVPAETLDRQAFGGALAGLVTGLFIGAVLLLVAL